MSSEHKPKKETKTNVAHPSLGNSQKTAIEVIETEQFKRQISHGKLKGNYAGLLTLLDRIENDNNESAFFAWLEIGRRKNYFIEIEM